MPTKKDVVQELHRRSRSGAFSENQRAAYQELQRREVLPPHPAAERIVAPEDDQEQKKQRQQKLEKEAQQQKEAEGPLHAVFDIGKTVTETAADWTGLAGEDEEVVEAEPVSRTEEHQEEQLPDEPDLIAPTSDTAVRMREAARQGLTWQAGARKSIEEISQKKGEVPAPLQNAIMDQWRREYGRRIKGREVLTLPERGQEAVDRAFIEGGAEAFATGEDKEGKKTTNWLRRHVTGPASSGVMQSVTGSAALLHRGLSTVGLQDESMADLTAELPSMISQMREEGAGESAVGDVLESSTRSLTDMYTLSKFGGKAPTGRHAAVIAGFGAKAGNRAIQRGRERGLQGSELAAYATGHASMEAGITSLFSLAGAAGLEKFGPAVKKGLKQGLKQAGWRSLQEIPEEFAVEYGQNLVDVAAELRENPGMTGEEATKLVASTVLSVGGAQAAQNINRKTQLGEDLGQIQNMSQDLATRLQRTADEETAQTTDARPQAEAVPGAGRQADEAPPSRRRLSRVGAPIETESDIMMTQAAQRGRERGEDDVREDVGRGRAERLGPLTRPAETEAEQQLTQAPQPTRVSEDGQRAVFSATRPNAKQEAERYADTVRQQVDAGSVEVQRLSRGVGYEVLVQPGVAEAKATLSRLNDLSATKQRRLVKEARKAGHQVNNKEDLTPEAVRDAQERNPTLRPAETFEQQAQREQAEMEAAEVSPAADQTVAEAQRQARSQGIDTEQVQDAMQPAQVADMVARQSPTESEEEQEATRQYFEAELNKLRYGGQAFVRAQVPIDRLDTQARGRGEYADQPAGEQPPIVAGSVQPDGPLTVVDGNNRIEAAQAQGRDTIEAFVPKSDAEALTDVPQQAARDFGTTPTADDMAEAENTLGPVGEGVELVSPSSIIQGAIPNPNNREDLNNLQQEAEAALADPNNTSRVNLSVVRSVQSGFQFAQNGITGAFRSLWDMGAPLDDLVTGRRFRQVLDNADNYAQEMIGRKRQKLWDAWNALDRGTRRWLMEVRDDGYTNMQAAVESHLFTEDPVADMPDARSFRDTWLDIQHEMGREAVDAGVMRKDGKEFKPAPDGRFFRHLTPQARSMLIAQSGPEWDAFVAWMRQHPELNPDVDVEDTGQIQEIAEELSKKTENPDVDQEGSLVTTREFQGMPAVLNVNGHRMYLIDTRPTEVLYNTVHGASTTTGLYRATAETPEATRAEQRKKEKAEKAGRKPQAKDKPLDERINRLRRNVVSEAQAQGKSTSTVQTAFENSLNAYTRKAANNVMQDVSGEGAENVVTQSFSVMNRNTKAAFLPLAGLYDLMTGFTTADRTGYRNMVRAYEEVMLNPKKNAREFQALGAITDMHMTFTPDPAESVYDAAGRVSPEILTSPSKAPETFAQAVSARAFQLWADAFRGGKIALKERQMLSEDLRLTESEIATLEESGINDTIREKIVRNGVRTSNHLAESAHRRGMITRNPVLRFVVPFMSVLAGVARRNRRELSRMQRNARQFMETGDKEIGKQLFRQVLSYTAYMLSIMGLGAGQRYLRRMVTGQRLVQPQDPDSVAEFMWVSLMDGGMFGLYSRFHNAVKYSNGSVSKIATSFQPQINSWLHTAAALSGWGPYEGRGVVDRLGETVDQFGPAPKMIRQWFDNMAYPEKVKYKQAQSVVFNYVEEHDEDKPIGERIMAGRYAGPSNPDYQPVFEAIRNDADREVVIQTIRNYFDTMRNRKVPFDKAKSRLKQSLTQKRPLWVPKDHRKRLLNKAPPADRELVREADQAYMRRVRQYLEN